MCTAVSYKTKNFYFGRTLDYDYSYAEEVCVTPRNFILSFLKTSDLKKHYAIIGMAFVPDKYPLYYDAMNEKGLCMAGLNFVGNAHYNDEESGKLNIAQFELIPYILGKCSSVKEAIEELKYINLANIPYAENMPTAQLHWIIADRKDTITVESVTDGIKIYDNKIGILTNNPPFKEQMFNLNNYMSLSAREPQNLFSDKLDLKSYSRGMGAIGLPGDFSSQSRFVRASFIKMNSVSGISEEESVNQFFHILNSVEQPRGSCITAENKYEITIYSSCCNADKGIYYYTTYDNHCIRAVDLQRENLDGRELKKYSIKHKETIVFEN